MAPRNGAAPATDSAVNEGQGVEQHHLYDLEQAKQQAGAAPRPLCELVSLICDDLRCGEKAAARAAASRDAALDYYCAAGRKLLGRGKKPD